MQNFGTCNSLHRCHRNLRHAVVFIAILLFSVSVVWFKYCGHLMMHPGLKSSSISTELKDNDNEFAVVDNKKEGSSKHLLSIGDNISYMLETIKLGSNFRNFEDSEGFVHNESVNLTSHKDKECRKVLPAALIIGIQKCGTAALGEFLRIHPNIAIKREQVDFFNNPSGKNLDWYREVMPCSLPHQVTLERTPAYFYFPLVPAMVKQMNSSIKLILIVRDPVARAVSNYAMSVYRHRLSSDVKFEDTVFLSRKNRLSVKSSSPFIERSTYHQYLKRWMNVFPRSQFHIIDGQKLILDPVEEIRHLETFLDIPHYLKHENFVFDSKKGFYCVRDKRRGIRKTCLPNGKGRQPPYVNPQAREVLRKYFEPHNRIFFKMVNKTFDW